MKSNLCTSIAVIGLALCAFNVHAQDHGHLNIGAVATNQGDPLFFDNGDLFATNSGFIMTLNYTNAGTYAGYYQGNITLTALAATSDFGGPDPNAPALGSQIFARIVSVQGPPGGSFAFWNTGATNPTISLASGTTGTNGYIVSQNGGVPGTDPFGHIHGRRFTATKPGIYLVGFQAFDISTNGAGGGPIQSPSAILNIQFQAGINIASVVPHGATADVTFGAALNRTYYVESTTNIFDPNSWVTVSTNSGSDTLQTFTDPNAAGAARYYRIRITTP